MNHPPTDEQAHILEQVRSGYDVKIEAGAGTGKTTTMEMVAAALPSSSRGLYLAFNKSLQLAAQARMPEPVRCKTVHALAYRDTGILFKTRLQQRLNGRMVAENILHNATLQVGDLKILPATAGNILLSIVERYCQSAEAEIGAQHLTADAILEILPAALAESAAQDAHFLARIQAQVFDQLAEPVSRLWLAMSDPFGTLPTTHDAYLKIWCLENHHLPFDFLLFDEGQDANAVILDLVAAQSLQKIFVGDRYQQLYRWRGAHNAQAMYYRHYDEQIENHLEGGLSHIEKQQKQQFDQMEAQQKQNANAENQRIAELNQEISSYQARVTEQAEAAQGANIEIQHGATAHRTDYTQTPAQVQTTSRTALSRHANAAPSAPTGAYVVPPNGFIQGILLNGVVAGANGKAVDTLIRLSGTYRSANGYHTNLSRCVVMAQAVADLPAGRINMKPARLTCTLDGETKTWNTAGWIVGHDGIRGIRGKIVDNTGKQLADSGIIGAISGVGNVISDSQNTNIYSTQTGAAASILTGNPYTAALGGAVTGVGQAMQGELQQYFSYFTPTIQVGGGRPVTVVLTSESAIPVHGRQITQTRAAP